MATWNTDAHLTDLYHQDCIKLARSFVIKSHQTAIQMNDAIDLQYYGIAGQEKYLTDYRYPQNWRYYRHLRGEYHYEDRKYFYNLYSKIEDDSERLIKTNRPYIWIKSLDTPEEIPFTKEYLALHRATYTHYKNQGEFYTELVEKYPGLVTLIDGILNPVDFDTAYSAPEWSILAHNESLVESNEMHLIDELNKQILALMGRFHSRGYTELNQYYTPYRMVQLAMQLPGMIIATREQYVGTIYAHSYHIWQYLAGWYGLDRYKRYLTTEQAIWLYRNIRYIDIHAGKQDTFEDLIYWLLSKRSIPLHSFNISRDMSGLDKDPTYSGGYHIWRNQMNLTHLDYSDPNDSFTISDLHDKEDDLALRNSSFSVYSQSLLDSRFSRSVIGENKTKLLEAEVWDYTNHDVYNKTAIRLNYWFYLSSNNMYPVTGSITNPLSGEAISMTAREGAVVYLYFACKLANEFRFGIEDILIPAINVYDIYFHGHDWDDLRENFVDNKISIDATIDDMRRDYVPPTTLYSVDSFVTHTNNVHAYRSLNRLRWSYTEDLHHSGEIRHLAERLMFRKKVRLSDESITFGQYLESKQWDLDDLTREQMEYMQGEILSYFTGTSSDDTTSVTEILKAMIEILRTLSSYSVQFTTKINPQDVTILDMPFIKVGHIKEIDVNEVRSYTRWLTRFIEYKSLRKSDTELNFIYTNSNSSADVIEYNKTESTIGTEMWTEGTPVTSRRERLGLVGFRSTSNYIIPIPNYYSYLRDGTLYIKYNSSTIDGVRLAEDSGKQGIRLTDPGVINTEWTGVKY